MTADDIAEALDDRGVSLSIGVTRHLLSLSCTCLAEDFGDVLAAAGRLVRDPSFPGRSRTRRGEIVTAIRQDEDNPAVAPRGADGAALRRRRIRTAGRAGHGRAVERSTRDDFVEFHARALRAAGARRSRLSGDVPRRAARSRRRPGV